MTSRFSHYFPLVIVGLLAGSTYWLEFVVRNERGQSVPSDRRAPDAYVEQVALDRFDAAGRHQFHLVAEKMTHYALDDTADFVHPRLLFKKKQRTLDIRSDRGHGTNLTREVVLEGNVIGVRRVDPKGVEQRLSTQQLTVFVDEEIAETDQMILATQGQSRIEAQGAEWNNASGTLKLGPGHATLMGRSTKRTLSPNAPE